MKLVLESQFTVFTAQHGFTFGRMSKHIILQFIKLAALHDHLDFVSGTNVFDWVESVCGSGGGGFHVRAGLVAFCGRKWAACGAGLTEKGKKTAALVLSSCKTMSVSAAKKSDFERLNGVPLERAIKTVFPQVELDLYRKFGLPVEIGRQIMLLSYYTCSNCEGGEKCFGGAIRCWKCKEVICQKLVVHCGKSTICCKTCYHHFYVLPKQLRITVARGMVLDRDIMRLQNALLEANRKTSEAEMRCLQAQQSVSARPMGSWWKRPRHG